MDKGDNPSATICRLCGEAFKLPEDNNDGNLPRVLLCGHTFCTFCMQSIQCNDVIVCPDCEVEFTLPEGGVYGLQEESRIVGLIYTARMNKMKSFQSERSKNRKRKKFPVRGHINASAKHEEQRTDIVKIERTVDEALVQAAENLKQLELLHETLTTGQAGQARRGRKQLEMEIEQATEKASQAIQKWKVLQMDKLSKLEVQVPSSQAEVSHIKERIEALKIAMQMAREIRRVPFLEQYCILDRVLETLLAPVDGKSHEMSCVPMGSEMSCVLQLESLNQSLALSLRMEESGPKHDRTDRSNGESPIKKHPEDKDKDCHGITPRQNNPPTPLKQDRGSPGGDCASSWGSPPIPKPRSRIGRPLQTSSSDLTSPDIIIEEFLDEEQDAIPPTGPELANDQWRTCRKKKNVFPLHKTKVMQWVVVTHVVNPSHFYVRYVAERRENEVLSKKIKDLCRGNGCCFTLQDKVETGCLIFVKCKEALWCRSTMIEIFQKGSEEPVESCPVSQLARIRVFFLDYGFTKSITIQSSFPRDEGVAESTLKAVNGHLRKAAEAVKAELSRFAPQAIRCSLKDLVPFDPTMGWSKEAQFEFHSVVGSAAVKMQPLGQDRDCLLVDLRKAPMEQSTDVPFSVREYLVFIEVARFYSPMRPVWKPLTYYPPVYPGLNREVDAVVCHINTPSHFYIQLVDNMETLLLSAKLQDCYNISTEFGEDKLKIYCPVIGQPCVARFEDKLWYRAQVIGHPGDRKVEVQYVDFGNKKILSVSDLRKIKDELFAPPAKAIQCCFADVIPLDGEAWSEASISRFISLAHQQLITIVATGTVPKSEPLPLKVFKSDLGGPKTNLAELLVKEDLARFKDGLKAKHAKAPLDDLTIWDPPLELDGGVPEEVDSPDQKHPEEQNEELFQPQLLPLAQLKKLKVRVSCVSSPNSFYVQFTQNNAQLERVCELVKQECGQMKPQDVEWQEDDYCAASINGVWERGRICSVDPSSNTAEVRRCDYGSVVKVPVGDLRPLPSSLTGSLALECTLSGIRPAGGRTTWTDTACDLISYYLTGTSAVMDIKELTEERPVPVTLSCSNKMGRFISIADFLVGEGLALRERTTRDPGVQQLKGSEAQTPDGETQAVGEEPTSTDPALFLDLIPNSTPKASAPARPKPPPRSIATAEKVTTALYQPPELPGVGPMQVGVSAIGEDGLIYVRTLNAEGQLVQLRERIQQSIKTLPRQKPYTWRSVRGCAVIGPDMLWHRGQLLEVQGGQVKVQYVDCGQVENIPVVHVYPILLCEDVPQLCLPCKLFAVNPVGGKWQPDAVALMKEALINRSVDMQVVELPSNPRAPFTVEVFLDGLSLSKILCHHEHASMDRSVSTQKGLLGPPAAPLLDDWNFNTEGLRGPEELMLGPFVNPKLPQEGEHFRLFLWPLDQTEEGEADGETLDEALNRINANAHDLPRLSSFPLGGPCLAEYSDGRFYRARLLRITGVEPVALLVRHVDFGSDDTLPSSK
ncbi:unnamed protein product [Menidia menidia]|uniref:(Atlantic silverside) hypothetical protein n=1 Tax=Menidia menidia TaxID=238744 RepID=A0A8S4AGU3_9TELE|nr:unnamed protein product [Menidia menidia]